VGAGLKPVPTLFSDFWFSRRQWNAVPCEWAFRSHRQRPGQSPLQRYRKPRSRQWAEHHHRGGNARYGFRDCM